MSRREILNKDTALKNAYIEDLKKNLDDLKAENGTLKSDLNAYSSLLMSLSDGVWSANTFTSKDERRKEW